MVLTEEETFLKRNPSKKLVIGVAIDGSKISDDALEAACGLYSEKRKDRLVILHVADSKKTFLPKNLQPKHLEDQYVDKAFVLHVRTNQGVSQQPAKPLSKSKLPVSGRHCLVFSAWHCWSRFMAFLCYLEPDRCSVLLSIITGTC